jgi:hypothetical protein
MKIYYVLSIAAAAVISTTVGANLVAADTSVAPVAQPAPVQATSLESLKAQSDSALTWRRPL